MSRPVVGLSCYVEPARWGPWDRPAALIPIDYVRALSEAGARVVIVPPDLVDADVVARLDGLVLAGGSDVDPARYGAQRLPTTDAPNVERDAGELLLYEAALGRGMPVLGICRGLQLMAIAGGGTLHQHLPDVVGSSAHGRAAGTFSSHEATFAAGSLAARAVGGTAATVNSSHHQAVADPARLTVTGWAADGVIEAAEDPAAPFVLGVQWHPEASPEDEVSRRVFEAFVGAAREFAASTLG